MKVNNGTYICDVDLEEKFTSAWNISSDLNLLNQAMLDFVKSKEVSIKMLDGIIEIYKLRLELLNDDFKNIQLAFVLNNLKTPEYWNESYKDCLNIIKDLEILSNYMKNTNMTTDELSNAILGLETLSNIKFEILFKQFDEIIKNINVVLVK